MTRPFFIDTADVKYIEKLWDTKIAPSNIETKALLGFTTNPNAIAKVGAHTMEKFGETVKKLSHLLFDIRKDKNGLIFVQAPSSKMTAKEKLNFLTFAKEASEGMSKVGLKITPYMEDISNLYEYDLFCSDINVTGVADCSTALACNHIGVKYISVIPGRMEEAGLDAKEQVQFLMERKQFDCSIIAGSMRTIEGLKWTVEYGCVPTIGTRVFDLMTIKDLNDFSKLEVKPFENSINFSPNVTEKNRNLSVAFFEQMDDMGKELYQSWLTKKT